LNKRGQGAPAFRTVAKGARHTVLQYVEHSRCWCEFLERCRRNGS